MTAHVAVLWVAQTPSHMPPRTLGSPTARSWVLVVLTDVPWGLVPVVGPTIGTPLDEVMWESAAALAATERVHSSAIASARNPLATVVVRRRWVRGLTVAVGGG
ncbi:hypothetical protein GCM10027596_41000 [Nocardioides korecus]